MISRDGVCFVSVSEQDKYFKELKKQLASAPMLVRLVEVLIIKSNSSEAIIKC